MPLEIREIIIRALVGGDKDTTDNKEKADDDNCPGNKDTEKKQQTVDAIAEIMKNNKER